MKLPESAKKAIEDHIKEAYAGLTDDQQASMFEIGHLKAETRDDIEFGYQLGYEQAKKDREKELRMAPIVDVRSATAIPYQLCPQCNGRKVYQKPGQSYNTAIPICDICNGAGIIPMAKVYPPSV